jgi:hypothetical protein
MLKILTYRDDEIRELRHTLDFKDKKIGYLINCIESLEQKNNDKTEEPRNFKEAMWLSEEKIDKILEMEKVYRFNPNGTVEEFKFEE